MGCFIPRPVFRDPSLLGVRQIFFIHNSLSCLSVSTTGSSPLYHCKEHLVLTGLCSTPSRNIAEPYRRTTQHCAVTNTEPTSAEHYLIPQLLRIERSLGITLGALRLTVYFEREYRRFQFTPTAIRTTSRCAWSWRSTSRTFE